MKGFAAALLAAAFVLLLGPAAHAIDVPAIQQERTTTRVNGTVRKLIVDTDGGDVIIRADERTTITRTEHWVYLRPTVRMTFHGGTLTITSRCPNAPLNNCSTDVSALIPSAAIVQAYTGDGLVRVTRIDSPHVHALTSNGNVLLSDVAADDVKATTTNGDVQVSLTSAPAATHLRSSNGNITAFVPRGSYALDVRAMRGDVRMRGVQNEPESERKLSALTRNGNITITGREVSPAQN